MFKSKTHLKTLGDLLYFRFLSKTQNKRAKCKERVNVRLLCDKQQNLEFMACLLKVVIHTVDAAFGLVRCAAVILLQGSDPFK